MLDSIHAWLLGVPDLQIRAVAAIGACIGVSMLLLALFADAVKGRGRNRRRCPTCWYDMSGSSDSLRCPECGHQARQESGLHRARRRWRWVFVGLLLLLFIPGGYIAQGVKNRGWYWLLPKYKTVSETTIAGCRVRMLTLRDPGEYGQAVEIKRGRTSILLEGRNFQLGYVPWLRNRAGRDTSRMIGYGTEITGNKIPDLIIQGYSGRYGSDQIVYICELDDPPVLFQRIDLGNGGFDFDDLDADGCPELKIRDMTFVGWHTPEWRSPQPPLILKCVRGQFLPWAELMCGPAPAAQELSDHAESIRNDPGWSIDPSTGFTVPLDLWNTMLNLIYTGHMDLAWKFYDDAWPPDKPGKNAFLAEFAQKLATSPYWHDIQAMNANAAPMPAQP